MAGAKETPRQKMIGMMYLVLTALLALNVSVDILDAFANLNEGIEVTNHSMTQRLSGYYNEFKAVCEKEGDKATPLWDKAEELKAKTTEFVNYVETLKKDLVIKTEGITEEEFFNPIDPENPLLRKEVSQLDETKRLSYKLELKNLGAKDKYDEPTNILINQKKAYELGAKIDTYREYLKGMLQEAGVGNAENIISTLNIRGQEYHDADKQKQDWENHFFYHMILAADVAILNKIVSDVQSVEYNIIDALWDKIGASDYKFNALQARVIAKSTYVLQGSKYEAEIFVAASDTTRNFNVKYNMGNRFNADNAKTVQSSQGIVKLQFLASGSGVQSYCGNIEMINPETGEIEPYPFEASYTVAPPAVTIAPTQMMIFYSGVKNPISVSSPGIASKDITVKISNGKIEAGSKQGEYLVSVDKGAKETTVTAFATIDGKTTTLGSYDFKVKRIPDPQAKIAGSIGGKLDKSTLTAAGAIIPDMGDFAFGDYYFTVVSYQLNTLDKGDYKSSGTINGGQFKGEAANMIAKSKRGDKLMFENIVVKGPDGVQRTLNSIIIEIK